MADEHTTVVHLVGCVCELCEARAEIKRLDSELTAIECCLDDAHAEIDHLYSENKQLLFDIVRLTSKELYRD